MVIQRKKFSEIFSVINISRHEPREIFLIHGLFATPGFWIPALPLLRGFSVTLIGVNYRALFLECDYVQVQLKIDQLTSYLTKKAHGDSFAIAHSLGSIFFCGTDVLPLQAFSMAPPTSVEVRNFNFDDFFQQARIDGDKEMLSVGETAISYLSTSRFEKIIRGRATEFHALHDKIFPVELREEIHFYSGGHFEVVEGVSAILSYLELK